MDEVVLGPAGAPPEGAADVEVVDDAGAEADVDVAVVGVEVVVDDVVGVELVLPAEAAVCVVPLDVVVAAWPPQPAAMTISVSAATALVSFEIMACLLPGHAEQCRRRPWESRARTGLLQALARFAHERNGLGEDHGHHSAQLFGLLLGRPLDVG
ncbi:MAG TPA: hypothetical protein VG371_08970, partial [Solirubrobacteraceae bacterium]|nr:hypothetical protein [Solirubrobacteraceae bacterium]